MTKTKKKNEPYFGPKVDQAISEYCAMTDSVAKTRLFNLTIYPALSKLAENVIHNRNLTNFGGQTYTDVKQDCICFLYEKLNKFDPDRGVKAFSYFNRISINWVWAKMRDVAKNTYGKCDVDHLDYSRDLDDEVRQQEIQEELQDFCHKWHLWGMEHLDYFFFVRNDKIIPFNKEEKQVLEAVFNLFKNSHSIDIYRKKALYILIREQVNVKTQIITNVVNVLRPLCQEMFYDFKKNGTLYWHRFLYYPEHIEGELQLPDDIIKGQEVIDGQGEKYKIIEINKNEIILKPISFDGGNSSFPQDWNANSIYDFWEYLDEEI